MSGYRSRAEQPDRPEQELGPETLQAWEKYCPFCAEVIRAAAIKCRYCSSDLPADEPDTEPAPPVALVTVPEETEEESESAEDAEAPDDTDNTEDGDDLSTDQAEAAESEPEPTLLARLTGERARNGGLAFLFLVACAVLWFAVDRAVEDDVAPNGETTSAGARAAVMAEGTEMIETAMSYRAATADEDIAAAKKLMTPSMQEDYEKTLPAEADRDRQAQMDITVTGRVASISGATPAGQSCAAEDCAVSVLSATPDKARLLAFVNQTANGKGNENSILSPTWEVLTLVREGDRWLIDGMESS